MGEWIGASICFSGRIGEELVPKLIGLIKEHGLKVDFDGDDPDRTNLHENFGDWQINYGCLDELEAFGVEHSLDYVHWFDRGPEWSSTTVRYVGGERLELIDGGGSPAITEAELTALGFEEALNRFALFKIPLPPLEIIPCSGAAREKEGAEIG